MPLTYIEVQFFQGTVFTRISERWFCFSTGDIKILVQMAHNFPKKWLQTFNSAVQIRVVRVVD